MCRKIKLLFLSKIFNLLFYLVIIIILMLYIYLFLQQYFLTNIFSLDQHNITLQELIETITDFCRNHKMTKDPNSNSLIKKLVEISYKKSHQQQSVVKTSNTNYVFMFYKNHYHNHKKRKNNVSLKKLVKKN
jgi:low affinity Fe/Cu permease